MLDQFANLAVTAPLRVLVGMFMAVCVDLVAVIVVVSLFVVMIMIVTAVVVLLVAVGVQMVVFLVAVGVRMTVLLVAVLVMVMMPVAVLFRFVLVVRVRGAFVDAEFDALDVCLLYTSDAADE